MRALRFLLLSAPFAAWATDALAWGLQTHVFYCQGLLLALPALDARLRAAVLRFPRLMLAGACMPDLALLGGVVRSAAFHGTHGWAMLRRLARATTCDEDRAITCGYASHLLSDVVAHNWFVPDHERRYVAVPVLTHALAEWAMDEHVRARVHARPAELLQAERPCLADFAARVAGCDQASASRAIDVLARADGALRAARVPFACRLLGRALDRAVAPRLESWLRETTLRLQDLGRVLEGAEPDFDAEGTGVALAAGPLRLPARFV